MAPERPGRMNWVIDSPDVVSTHIARRSLAPSEKMMGLFGAVVRDHYVAKIEIAGELTQAVQRCFGNSS
jgi:hypothetical protein